MINIKGNPSEPAIGPSYTWIKYNNKKETIITV